MSTGRTKPCPFCGEAIAAAAVKCRFCGEFVEDAVRPNRPLPVRESGDEAVQFLLPVNVSGWSLAAFYAGLFGMCIPIFALPAVIFAIIALRRRSKRGDYGAVTGDMRAIIGLICGGIGVLWGGALLVILIIAAFTK